MKRSSFYLFLFLFSLSSNCSFSQLKSHSMNPIIWADVPDNAIIRVDDTYYMSSTTMHMNPGLPIMKSKNLVDWEMLNYAYNKLADNDEMNLNNGKNCYGAGSWASSFRYNKGVYYVSTFSATSGKTHVYSTKDIEKGNWKESTFEPVLHDHTLFFDDDGRVYMIYGGGEIRIIELTADASSVKEGGVNQVIIKNATKIAGGVPGLPAEGSQMIKKDGKYYLFNIAWPQEEVRTELVHRADHITGPYEGKIFIKDRGIAQGSLIDTPEGDWYAYMFRDFGAVGRIPFLIPVNWVDGWPVVAGIGRVPEILDIPSAGIGVKGIVASDEFKRRKNAPDLPLSWQWNHNPDNKYWSVDDERRGHLRITTGRVDTDIIQVKNMLTQRTFGPESSAEISVDVSRMKDGDYAGMILLQQQYGYVAVKQTAGKRYVVMISNESGKETELSEIPLNKKRVYFRADCDYNVIDENSRADRAYFYYSLNGRKWMFLGEPLTLLYTLPHFMGYRFGLFNMATQEAGGAVDFDYFRITDKIAH